jgi:hypothetical protein
VNGGVIQRPAGVIGPAWKRQPCSAASAPNVRERGRGTGALRGEQHARLLERLADRAHALDRVLAGCAGDRNFGVLLVDRAADKAAELGHRLDALGAPHPKHLESFALAAQQDDGGRRTMGAGRRRGRRLGGGVGYRGGLRLGGTRVTLRGSGHGAASVREPRARVTAAGA